MPAPTTYLPDRIPSGCIRVDVPLRLPEDVARWIDSGDSIRTTVEEATTFARTTLSHAEGMDPRIDAGRQAECLRAAASRLAYAAERVRELTGEEVGQ